MTPVEQLLCEMAAVLPGSTGDPTAGLRIEVEGVQLALPIESSLGTQAELYACLPRGTMHTGFDPPLGTLTAHFVRRDD